jgi:hypothetical protein
VCRVSGRSMQVFLSYQRSDFGGYARRLTLSRTYRG